MKSSFAALKQNNLTRRFGGTITGVADPYISGYFFVFFDKLPTGLASYTQLLNGKLASTQEIQTVLSATCLSCTPPGGTLNKVDFTGLGGVKWAVPGNIDYGNSVSLKFLEMSKTPIGDIMHSWVKMIRDYRTGVTGSPDKEQTLIDREEGDGYSNKTYSSLLYYFTTAPDAKTIEYFACYDGVWPTKDPQDLYTSDVETAGKLEIEIEFNVDYAWHEQWVYNKCVNLVSTMGLDTARTTVQTYGSVQAG